MPELSAGMMVTPSLRLERLIGEGAMGSVWVAEHLTLATNVAVKFIARDHRVKSREAVLTRFEREARAAAQIKSPHVVHMYDHGVMESGTPYIVMELLEGESLGARLRRGGPMPVDDVVALVRQVCKALAKAHELGIIHRDIKPDNIFLLPSDDDLFAKVLDFGIAKTTTDPHEAVTTTGAMLGTPLYMSPEVVKSARQADHRADLWALAVVAYEALVGKPPFRGETVGALFFSICGDPVEPPSSRRKGLPRALDGWFSRALCQDPARRFDSAREVAESFASAAESAAADDEVAPSSEQAANTALLGTAEFISREELDASLDAADEQVDPTVASEATSSGSVAGTSAPPADLRVTKPAAGIDEPESAATAAASEGRVPEEAAKRTSAKPASLTLSGASASAPPQRKPRAARLLAAAVVATGLLGGGYFAFGDGSGAPAEVAADTSTPASTQQVPLRIRCDDGCDLFTIDGHDYRRDELADAALQHGETPKDGELRIKVSPGRHRLRVERDGYVAVAEDIDVIEGIAFDKRFHLEPKVGRLPQEVLSRIMSRNKTKYWACYDVALERDPKLRGRVDVSFVIDPRGNVNDVTASGVGDEALHSCIQQSFRSISFPAPEGGGPVEVRYPMDLEPKASVPASTKKNPATAAAAGTTTKGKKAPPQKKKYVSPPNDDEPIAQNNDPPQQQQQQPQQPQQQRVVQEQSKQVYDDPPPVKK